MDMALVPRYADEGPAEAGVRIDPGVVQNLGVRLAVVESAPVSRTVTAAGVIVFSERAVAVVQARAAGFVERAYGRAVGDVVSAGTPIVDIRVPEWTAAQAEYLALRSAGGDLAAAARRRLEMLGMPASLIERVERDGAPRPVVTVTAPVAGAITALDIRNGMTIVQGAPLATINGISPVWLAVSLAQADASIARTGGRVTARVPAYPGESFSRTHREYLAGCQCRNAQQLKCASHLPMPHGRLRPGMTAEVAVARSRTRVRACASMIPAEAVIRTWRAQRRHRRRSRTAAIAPVPRSRLGRRDPVIASRVRARFERRAKRRRLRVSF